MRNRLRAKCFALAALAVGSLALVPPASAKPLNISVGWVVMSGPMAPLVFEKPGILMHYGKTYTVEPVHFKGTSPQLTALAAGQLDVATLAYSSFALGIENAHLTNLRIIADGFQDGHPGYASIPYMVRNNGDIKTIADLKGKTLAVNVIGAAVDIGGRAVLAKHGLDFPRDYSIIESPFSAIGAMLLQGKAAVASLPPPFNFQPDVEKGAHTLFTMKEGMGTSQMIVVVTTKGFIAKHRAALADFLDDLVRGTHWMLDPAHRQAAIKFVARVTHQPTSLYEPYFLTRKDQYRDPNATPDLAALQRNIDTQVKFGFLKHKLNVRNYADLSLVKAAAKRYAQEVASAK